LQSVIFLVSSEFNSESALPTPSGCYNSSQPQLTTATCDLTLHTSRITEPNQPEGYARMLLSPEDHSRIIEMAWEDRTPFEAIEHCYRLTESDVIRRLIGSA
jgi:Protein of unknown function (DUF2805).